MSLALLLAAATATAVGAAALHAAHGLRKQLAALRAELAVSDRTAATSVPAARTTPAEEIRAAVADALAEERERELAEARAFWAAQEARDADGTPSMLGGFTGFGTGLGFGPADEPSLYLPRQADFAGLEPMTHSELAEVSEVLESIDAVDSAIEAHERAHEQGTSATSAPAEGSPQEAGESPDLAAARRRHPSHPDFTPGRTAGAPGLADHERTMARLEQLAADATPLSDVRPGPLGTLDVYVFSDGTTVCMTPGHRETAEQLAEALRAGKTAVLLGGSGLSGAYALTFAFGEEREESVFVLADRVIASL
ncbi:hypothetical protein AB0C51_15180 [Streptomyces pathocidini]|uniref:hypothetical protein n=1 Tax=Streptomyces pathocidini TaxID=1650571 RepID=UPI0033CC4AF4